MKNNSIDWEQVRIDASINIMNAILSSSIMVFVLQFIFKKQISDIAVKYADELIQELQKKMKKPSKIKAIKAKKAWFLPSGFVAMTLFGVAYCSSRKKADEINKTDGIDNQLESHETIHVRQAESTSNSWFVFYLKYLFQWLHNLPLIFINIHAPYKFMPFELEAYANQDDWDYCLDKCNEWKVYKTLTMKQRRKFAKEYFNTPIKLYFTEFIEKKVKPELFSKS